MFDQVNWLAVVGAAIASFVIGYLWYGPLFGERWMALVGKRPEDVGGPSLGPILAVSFFVGLVGATALAAIVTAFQSDVVTSAFVGVLVWVASGLVLKMNDLLFAGRPAGLFYIDSIHHLVTLVVMAVIVGAFRA
ncbi:MAG: DUF1761 domain-containing protein [Candidatus Limnocylindria bacterium]